jgi:hypothetical protein
MKQEAQAFVAVARQLWDGEDPPEWVAVELARRAWLIAGPERHYSKQDRHEHNTLVFCLQYLTIWLIRVEAASAEMIGEEVPECIENLDAAITEVFDYLQEHRIPDQPRDGRRVICAGVCARVWRARVGKAQPYSTRLGAACEEYWIACGHSDESGTNWEHFLTGLGLSHP